MLGPVRPSRACVGPPWAHVGPMSGHLGPQGPQPVSLPEAFFGG